MNLKKRFFAGTVLFLTLTVVFLCLPVLWRQTTMKQEFHKNYKTQAKLSETITENSLLKIDNIKNQGKTTAKQKNLLNSTQNKLQHKYKLILLYTPVFGSIPWLILKNTNDFTTVNGKPCQVTNCRLTYDKKELARSDVVVFHGMDLPSVNTMKKISRKRNWKQRWVFFIQENPYNTLIDTKRYNGFFNWTMTYRRDSDIFAPYRNYASLDSTKKQASRVLKNYAQGKDRFIAWMVSHCGTLRDKVTVKLLKYVNVTVFGACGKHFNQTNRCIRNSADCHKLLKRFKFYLAFENANCIDYVTEKYWYTPFTYDMIPIVLGPLKYDWKIAIPGSYINVMDFPSVESLARYLKYLDNNDTAYNEYFQWKSKYELQGKENLWRCQLCADVNNPNLPTKVYNDLGGYWDKKNSCGKYEDEVRKLLQR